MTPKANKQNRVIDVSVVNGELVAPLDAHVSVTQHGGIEWHCPCPFRILFGDGTPLVAVEVLGDKYDQKLGGYSGSAQLRENVGLGKYPYLISAAELLSAEGADRVAKERGVVAALQQTNMIKVLVAASPEIIIEWP